MPEEPGIPDPELVLGPCGVDGRVLPSGLARRQQRAAKVRETFRNSRLRSTAEVELIDEVLKILERTHVGRAY
jgi:hypothetical protein